MYLANLYMPSMAYFRFYYMKQFSSKQRLFAIYTGNNNIFPINKTVTFVMPPKTQVVYLYENSRI